VKLYVLVCEVAVILYLNFEELSALGECADHVLAAGAGHGIAAPPHFIAEVEHFAHIITGDVNIPNIAEQKRMQAVVNNLLGGSRSRLDRIIVEQHAAAEDAIAAYFNYAHVLTVARRIESIGLEMSAIIELMTGETVDSEAGRRFSFED
jgi:hypothetical protein